MTALSILYVGKAPIQYGYKTHHHNNWEIIINTHGTGIMEFEDETHPFDERTVVCIPPHIGHSKRSADGFLDMWVWFPDLPEFDTTKPTFLTDDSDHNIAALVNVLYSVQYGKAPNKQTVVDSLLDSLQQLLLSRLDRKKIDPRVEQIVNHIVHHFQDPTFVLADCLSQYGYCTDHMRRLFHDEIGKTPHEYLTSLRIKTAKKLLISRRVSNHSVTAIANMAGFYDVSYFSRIFKKATGVSPKEYRGHEDHKGTLY